MVERQERLGKVNRREEEERRKAQVSKWVGERGEGEEATRGRARGDEAT